MKRGRVLLILGVVVLGGGYGYLMYQTTFGAVIALFLMIAGLVCERNVFTTAFQKKSFLYRLSLRSVVYGALMLFGLVLLTLVATGTVGIPFIDAILFFFIIVLANLIAILDRILGIGMIYRYISGKYFEPVEEDRIFMFLDLKDSTTVAEKIGSKRFHLLLREFFFDITQVILEHKGEIYSYVGDEIIITWTGKNGVVDANCVRCFYAMLDVLKDCQPKYYKRYKVFISFKAGMHCGTVVAGEMGDYKRDIVYLGDVVNTTARIQSTCTQYGAELLLSGDLLNRLDLSKEFEAERIGLIKFKGKENRVELFSINHK